MKTKNLLKKAFLLLALMGGASNAWSSTVDDLVTISENYTFIADDITSNGTVKLVANTLYDGGFIFAPTANTVATNKGSNTFAGGSHLNSLRLKNTQDQLCFKVSGACTVTFYTQSHASRGIQVGSVAGGTQYGTQTASTTEWSCNITAAGVVYLSSYNGDFYFAGFKVTFPKPEITAQPVSAAYQKDDAATALSVTATASKGDLSYQWYSCEDANKTNASAIGGATSASYTPATTSNGTFYYFCRVSDANGSTDSNVATIIVAEASAPTISADATATSVFPNTSVTLTATIGGIPEPTVQWYSCDDALKTNPVSIGGATNTTYSPSTATPGTYYFYAVATNSQGNATSDVITLTVNPLYTITYSLGEVTGTKGIVPAPVDVESSLTIPSNWLLYKDGYTLTAWNDGSADHAIGSNMTVTANTTLTPVFTANGENAHIGYNTTTVTWDFQTKNGAPTWALEGAGKTGFQVAQTTVGGSSIDVKLDIDATSGKFNNASNNDWAQTNSGTKLTVPVLDGAVVKLYVYQEGSSPVTFGGNAGTYASNIYSYTATEDGDLDIVIGDQGYTRYVSVTYPSETLVLNVTSNNTEALLTRANIEGNDYLSATTDSWQTNKTYGGITGDFVNMSKDTRYITIKVTGASAFEVYVQNSNAGRTYTVKVGSGDAQGVTHGGTGVESSGVFAIADPSAETTIKIAGGGSAEGSVYPVYVNFNPAVSITPANNWSTYVASYALDFSDVEGGLKAYVATDAAAGKVTLEPVGAVPAGTPLMLVGTATTEYTVPVVASASEPETNMFRAGDGTTPFDGSTYDYILFSDGLFYQIGSGTVATNKAYLHCDSNPTTSLARELRISFGDNITGIDQIDNGQLTMDNSQDGKFIENGKLVIVKNGVKYNAAGAQVK